MNEIQTTWFLFGKQSDIPNEFSISNNFAFYRFYCVIEGECFYKDEKNTIKLEKGNIYLLPRKSYSLCPSKEGMFVHAWGHFQIKGWQFDTVITFNISNDPIIGQYFNLIDTLANKYILKEQEMPPLFHDDIMFTTFKDIFSSCASYLYYNFIHFNERPHAFDEVIAYINNNLESDLSNNILAKKSKYSRTHFIQEFTRFYQISPQKYVTKARISKAISLLMKNEKLYNIAYSIGYNNPKSFSRAFKRETGLSPQEYKDLHYCKIHHN